MLDELVANKQAAGIVVVTRDAAGANRVYDVRRAVAHLVDAFDRQVHARDEFRRATRRGQPKTHRREVARDFENTTFVEIVDAEEHGSGQWQTRTRRHFRFGERSSKITRVSHHFAGAPHFGTEQRVRA